MSVTVLCGGVGAARFLRGLVEVVDASLVTAVVNVADDTEMHGLHVSPDLDTVTYTLADAIDPERGWGLVDETWQAMGELGRYGNPTWFSLGDRDLATHIVRTERLRRGDPLSAVTAHVAASWGVGATILPVTDDPVRTMVTVAGEDPAEIGFQEYFVGRRHDVAVTRVRFDGADEAAPAPGVTAALDGATAVVIAPSNPVVSIDPVLSVPGIREAVAGRRERTVAVSPIVAGAALKGPAARLLRELGHEASVVGIARLYRDVAGTLVVDTADAHRAAEVEAEGMRCVVADTIMASVDRSAALAARVLEAA